MLYLNLHPMQKTLPRNALLKSFERVLCDSVCAVGVDVNSATEVDHLGGCLQFVPGLGPRKALALKQNLKKNGKKVSRDESDEQ